VKEVALMRILKRWLGNTALLTRETEANAGKPSDVPLKNGIAVSNGSKV